MAIKRISELDLFTNADLSQFLSTINVTDSAEATYDQVPDKRVYDPSKLSVGLWFEVSTPLSGLVSCDGVGWKVKNVNEAVSYYLSKKINAEDLEKVFGWRFNIFMENVLSGPINYIGSQNFGEAISSFNDGFHEVWYDNRDYLPDENGDPDPTKPNNLCVMIKADFTNKTTFHNVVDFHNTVNISGPDNKSITFHTTTGDTHTWNGQQITLSGPWAEFPQDIVVDGTAYLNNLYVASDIHGCCLSAKWADLAENYESDKKYPPGTLIKFGGENEITVATDTVNAVVTTRPGISLNGNSLENNLGIALVGRVPVRVVGKVRKFNKIGLSEIPGVGIKTESNHIGIALESSDNEKEKLVECVVQLML